MGRYLMLVALLVVFASLHEDRGLTASLRERPTLITVQQAPDWTEPPLEIVGVTVGDRVVTIGRSFQAKETWLKDLTVTVRNVSKIPIIGFSIDAMFRSDKLPYLEMRRGIDYLAGQMDGENIVLRPGETMDATVESSWYTGTMFHAGHLEGLPEDILNNVSLRINYVGYDANTIWVKGNHMYRTDTQTFTTDKDFARKAAKMLRSAQEQKEQRHGLMTVSYRPPLSPWHCR